MLRVFHEILMWLQEKYCTYWSTFFYLCGRYLGQMSNVGFSYEIGVIISAGGVLQKLYCMLPDKVYVVILDLEENSPQYPA